MPKNDIEEERSLEEISRIYMQAVRRQDTARTRLFPLAVSCTSRNNGFVLSYFGGNKGFIFCDIELCLDKEVICVGPVLPPTWDFAT